MRAGPSRAGPRCRYGRDALVASAPSGRSTRSARRHGDTEMVLRLACARLHPPFRPQGFTRTTSPRLLPPPARVHRAPGRVGARSDAPRRGGTVVGADVLGGPPRARPPAGQHGGTGTRRAVLRRACARLHPPPRPQKGFYTHDIPTPPDGPARGVRQRPGHPQPGIKQPMTDVRVKQLSTSSVPSCLRALRVDRPEAFKQDYYAVKSHFARRGRVARPPTGQHGARGDTGTRRWF